jgi:hypothetical protein
VPRAGRRGPARETDDAAPAVSSHQREPPGRHPSQPEPGLPATRKPGLARDPPGCRKPLAEMAACRHGEGRLGVMFPGMQHERAFGRITGGARKDAGKRHLRGGLPGGGSVPSGPRAWTQGTGIAAQWDGPLLPPAGRGVRACLRCRVGDRCDRHSVSHPRQTWHVLTSGGSRSCHSGTPILQQGGSSARFHLYARVPLPEAHGG